MRSGYANMCSYAYVELHCHSAFSFLDGASLPEELRLAAAERGYDALALTDHNAVSGSMEFAQAAAGARAAGDPRRGGRRRWTAPAAAHLTLLVRDARGWRSLCRLLTRAHAHTRDKPRRDRRRSAPSRSTTSSEHAEGLVCLSGCARHGVRDEPTMRRLLRGLRARPPSRRAPAPVPAPRPRAATAAWPRSPSGSGVRDGRDRQRPRARARARAAAGRVRRDPRAHDARRLRAAAPRQPRARARHARRRWRRASPTIPRRSRETARARRDADLRPRPRTSATATRAPRTRRADRELAELCRARFDGALPARQPAPRGRRARGWRRSCA